VTGRSDRAGHERNALGHRWRAPGSFSQAPSSGTVWGETLAGQAVSTVSRASCRGDGPADGSCRPPTYWPRPCRHARGQAVTRSWPQRCSVSAGRAVHNVYVDQRRGALVVVWGAKMGRSMSARASALDAVGAITRARPNRRSPLQSCRLPGVVLPRRRSAPGRAAAGESYEGGHDDEV